MNELKKHTKKLLSSTRPDTYTRESAEYVISTAERCEAAEALCAELRDALKDVNGQHGGLFDELLAKTPESIGAELAALREDRARLEWMMDMSIPVNLRLKNQPPKTVFLNTRADIDAARKEAGK